MKNSSGFTLIEMVIVIVLVGILATIAATIIMQGVRAYSDEQSRSDAHYQARLAVERMSREIRLIRGNADISVMNGTLLRFTDINGSQMGFRLNGGNIERTEDNAVSWQTLATNITGTGGNIFTYLDDNGATTAASTSLWLVQIQFIATQGTESIDIRTTVHPRNF
jgi:MSHA biogenesis protein MshO